MNQYRCARDDANAYTVQTSPWLKKTTLIDSNLKIVTAENIVRYVTKYVTKTSPAMRFSSGKMQPPENTIDEPPSTSAVLANANVVGGEGRTTKRVVESIREEIGRVSYGVISLPEIVLSGLKSQIVNQYPSPIHIAIRLPEDRLRLLRTHRATVSTADEDNFYDDDDDIEDHHDTSPSAPAA